MKVKTSNKLVKKARMQAMFPCWGTPSLSLPTDYSWTPKASNLKVGARRRQGESWEKARALAEFRKVTSQNADSLRKLNLISLLMLPPPFIHSHFRFGPFGCSVSHHGKGPMTAKITNVKKTISFLVSGTSMPRGVINLLCFSFCHRRKHAS